LVDRQIRIGNQTAFSAVTPLEPFEYAVKNGFSAFEWFPDKKESGEGWDEDALDTKTRRYIAETALARDMALTVHAPWRADPLEPESHALLLKAVGLARDVKAVLLNIHLHDYKGIKAYVEAVRPIIRLCAESGIRLSMENTPFTGPEDFNALFALLRGIRGLRTDHVGMCLDIGHANLHGPTLNDYLGFMDRLDKEVPIIHIHMHENHGDYDSHLPLFTGPAGGNDAGIRGFMERIRKRRFSGCLILEQWPEPPALLNEARERLYRMLDAIAPEEEPPRKKGSSENCVGP
jgi:sugar phosphate isomerase/epimerase